MLPTRWIALWCVLALLAGCGSDGGGTPPANGQNAPVTSTLSGQVLTSAGQAVAGVTIQVFHHNTNTTQTTVTDAQGHYRLSGLDTGRNSDYAIYATQAGAALYPSSGDSAGTLTRFDFNGLYRSVVRFATVPARDIGPVNFTAYHAGEAVMRLPRTAQTTSYAAGDDGALRQGLAAPGTRFTNNQDGSVTDHLTGLVWLQDAGCFTVSTWATALGQINQLASGQCGLSDGSQAGQWRMPNANELESLVDVSQSAPALAVGHPFSRVNLTTAYWTSTTYMAGSSNAMALRFSDGRWINGVDANDGAFNNLKAGSQNAVWAVRTGSAPGTVKVLATGVYAGVGGGSFGAADDAALQGGVPLNAQRFIDQGDGTLADTLTGLVWLKKADCIQQDWAGALAAVQALQAGQCGLSDGSSAGQWRMPNRTEMLSLSDRAPTFPQAAYLDGQYQGTSTVTGPVVFDHFVVSAYYWTSTTQASDPTQAWSAYSCDFGIYNLPKTDVSYTLAVR